MLQAQSSTLNYQSRQRYLATQLAFSQWCEDYSHPWHSSSIPEWLSQRQMSGEAKPWAENTMLQKLTHLNFLTTSYPVLLPGGQVVAPRLVPGLGKFAVPLPEKDILPPSYLISLSLLEQPLKIHTASQVQALTGLRSGQMCLINPMHLITPGVLIAPPFKRQKHTVLLDIQHVPKWLIDQFLQFQSNGFSPILPWTAVQYQAKFKKSCAEFGLARSSHAARHTYATVHAFLNEPRALISQILIHKQQRTLKAYVHQLSDLEQGVVLSNPEYFRIRKF